MKPIATAIALAFVAAAFLPSDGAAYTWYYNWVKNTYPLTDRTSSCVICHSRKEGEDLNAYGAAFRLAGAHRRALAAIEGHDDDGDGVSNAAELRTGHFPGDSSDVPTRAELTALRTGKPIPVDVEQELLATTPCPCCDKPVLECECEMVPEIRRIVKDGVAQRHPPSAIREALVARFGPDVLSPAERKTTLPPKHFSNRRIERAYRIAKEIPRELEKYPCFCECYRDNGHLSLLDCYKNEHGSRCGVCMAEADLINGMVRRSQPEARIRESLLRKFGHEGKQ